MNKWQVLELEGIRGRGGIILLNDVFRVVTPTVHRQTVGCRLFLHSQFK